MVKLSKLERSGTLRLSVKNFYINWKHIYIFNYFFKNAKTLLKKYHNHDITFLKIKRKKIVCVHASMDSHICVLFDTYRSTNISRVILSVKLNLCTHIDMYTYYYVHIFNFIIWRIFYSCNKLELYLCIHRLYVIII